MIEAVSISDVRRVRVGTTSNARERWTNMYFGHLSGDEVRPEPQAFRVDMHENKTTKAHFHSVDQFQVFFSGSGTLGRDRIDGLTLHYTDHHTGYGPLVAGPYGFSYFTLRAYTDARTVYLDNPAFREKLKPSKKRHHMVRGIALSTGAVMAARPGTVLDTLIEPAEDGLSAYVLRAGAQKYVAAPGPDGSGGHYVLVANGALVYNALTYPTHSMIWVSRNDPGLSFTSSRAGVELLVMQFPADRHVSG